MLSGIFGDFLTLLRDREMLKLIVGFGLGLGLFNAVLTDLQQLVQPVYFDHPTNSLNATAQRAAVRRAAALSTQVCTALYCERH